MIENTHGVERGAQAQWARDYEKTPQNVNNWLRGLSYPDVELMIKLCEKRGFTLDWLYRGVDVGISKVWEEYLRDKSRASQVVSRAKERQAP